MDFSNISDLITTISKYFNNTGINQTNNSNTSFENLKNINQTSNNINTSSFPEPLNISQDVVLNNNVNIPNNLQNNFASQNNIQYNSNQTQPLNSQNQSTQQVSNPLNEISKLLNPDTIRLIQQFLPMLNNLKGNNILSGLTSILQGNKKNNTNKINVVSNKSEIEDIESLIRIDIN